MTGLSRDANITILCGGNSSERKISLNSGAAVHKALVSEGYSRAHLFDLQDNLSELLDMKPDVVYLALHGKGGEDGAIQGALELAGIPYTGPGVAASAVCMNKILTKQVLASAGLPTAPFLSFFADEGIDISAVADEIFEKIGLPAVLKSPSQGSSIGVIIVKEKEKLCESIKELFELDDLLMAEKFLDGTEITIPLIGNSAPTTLPIVEIVSDREFYDFEAKYTSGLCHHIIPARITEKDAEDVKKLAEKAYRVLGCRGISRIDFIIDRTAGPMIVEVNTSPGMTDMSLVPDSAKFAGLSFVKLIETVLQFGLEEKDA